MSRKYIKKTSMIEAFQYDGDLLGSNSERYVPDWAIEAFNNGELFYTARYDMESPELFFRVDKTAYLVEIGDYIARDASGRIITYNKGIFEQLFELV